MAIFPGDRLNDLNDMLMGTAMDDVLWGGVGDDQLSGGEGNDRLEGGPGGDNLDGGPGMDIADYTGSMDPVHVDLVTPFSVQDDDPAPVRGGDAEGDILTSIEHIWGSRGADTLIGNHVGNILAGHYGDDRIAGGSGADQLYGEAGHDILRGGDGSDVLSGGMGVDELVGGDGNDILRGGDGDDALYGEDGADVLEGGGGADILDGGDGSDTAAYTMSGEGVTVNLSYVGTARPEATGGDAMGDEFEPNSIENVRGSDKDDKLTGDGEKNKLYGNQGEDTLMGGASDDMLRGGKDDDELEGGAGNDTLRGDKGDDTLTGDEGEDTFHLMEGDGDDTITDFESGEDTIKFGTATQKFTASEIRDILDTEDEKRDGTFTYEWEDVSVNVDQPLTAADLGAKASSTSLDDGPNIWPESYDVEDTELRGDNVVHGLGGDDEISGGRGDDSLFGNAGDDRLMGEEGDDTLNGGRGNDNLRGGDDVDVLLGGPGDDVLGGDRHNDELTGGSGKDTFWFGDRDGHDTITDFATGDIISLGGSALEEDEIDEVLASVRENDDGYYTYDWKNTSFTVNRALTADDFEKPMPPPDKPAITLSDNADMWPEATDAEDFNDGDDVVYGRGGDDVIMGGRGMDMIAGDGGNDMLDGGRGNDTLKGGMGNDDLDGGRDDDMLKGESGMDDLMGGSGDDMLYGGSGADTLMGGADDDVLTGGFGNDTFNFGSDDGVDMITDFESVRDYRTGGSADMIMLGTGPIAESEAQTVVDTEMPVAGGFSYMWGNTTFTVNQRLAVEDFDTVPPPPEPVKHMLTDQADTWGDATDTNATDYNGGDDYVDGDGGNDNLMGGAGNDTLKGGDRDDTLAGEEGDDSLYGDDGADNLMGGAGNDMLMGGDGMDSLEGGPGDDMVYADHEDVDTTVAGTTVVLTGGAGEDTLSFMNSSQAIGMTGAGNAFELTDEGFENLIGSPEADFLEAGVDPTATVVDTTNLEMVDGGGGDDTLTVDSQVDNGVELNGGAGNDTITGGDGDDMLDGGEGMDSLVGGAGNDMLDGGAGMDTLTGGDGSDTFMWGDGDRITDFTLGVDERIDLPGDVMQVVLDLHNGALRATLKGGTMDGETMVFEDTTGGVGTTVPGTEPTYRTLLNELFSGGDLDLYAL